MPVFENEQGRQLGAPAGSRLESQLIKERWTPVDDAPAPKKAAPATKKAPAASAQKAEADDE